MKAEIISANKIGVLNFFLPLCFRSDIHFNQRKRAEPFEINPTTNYLSHEILLLPKVFFVLVVFIAVGAIYGLLDFKMGSVVAHAHAHVTQGTPP